MKTKLIEKPENVLELKVGDYFATRDGSIRQITRTGIVYYATAIEDGVSFFASSSVEEVIEEYGGNIKKVEIIGFDRKTKEVIFSEEGAN